MKDPKCPRVHLHPSDGPWVASAAAIAGQTPKAYIEKVLVPIASAIVESGEPTGGMYFPSPPGRSGAFVCFSLDQSTHRLLHRAARIEKMNLKQFCEKHLLPTAKAEAIAWVKAEEHRQKIA